MVLQTSSGSARRLHVVRFVLLALGGLLVGHQTVYLSEYGGGGALTRAMAATGHGAYWPAFTTLALSGLLLLLVRSAWQLVVLRTTTGVQPRPQAMADHVRSYRRELLMLWPPLFGTVAVAYLVQENIEHLAALGHLAGFTPLVGLEAPFALPILGLVTLAFAVVGALLRWRIAILTARAAACRRLALRWLRTAHAPHPAWTLVGAIRATFWSLARQGPVRAPPAAA